MKQFIAAVILAVVATSSFAFSTGDDLRADTFKGGEVNTAKRAEVINILSVQSAKVAVSNEQAQKQNAAIGNVVGGIAGALLGNKFGGSTGAALGGAVGVAVGNTAGASTDGTALVDGVTLTFVKKIKGEFSEELYVSSQVGKVCEFQVGQSIMVADTTAKESRIQTNATCAK